MCAQSDFPEHLCFLELSRLCSAGAAWWREDQGLLSRSGRKRRPTLRDEGGVSGVSSSCGARGGFLPRHDEDLILNLFISSNGFLVKL